MTDTLASTSTNGGGAALPRYAVVFRTHFWDAFVDRQFARLQAQVGRGDIYVLCDQTRGPVPGIPTDKLFPVTDQQVLDEGFVEAGEGSIQWFSGDVPLYLFREAYPDYDYYLQLEYDVNVHVPLDEVIARIAADKADIVALEKRDTPPDWNWMPSLRGVYPETEATHRLICLSVYSSRALVALAAARREQARRYKAGELPAWPFCEAFVPIEGKRQGLKLEELSRYGSTDCYDWWPPFLESELPTLAGQSFVHPVLDTAKYVASIYKYTTVYRLVLPNSVFHKKMRRLGPVRYAQLLAKHRFRYTLYHKLRSRFGFSHAEV